MGTLNIDLQDGFAADDVRITVNGKQVFLKPGVTTKLLLGLADTTHVPVEDGPTRIEVSVPSREMSHVETIQTDGDAFVGVALEKQGLRFLKSGGPFGYG